MRTEVICTFTNLIIMKRNDLLWKAALEDLFDVSCASSFRKLNKYLTSVKTSNTWTRNWVSYLHRKMTPTPRDM